MSRLPICVLLLSLFTNLASAHYLWIDVDAKSKVNGVANIYFEESPNPGDGSYLDHFLGSSDIWIRTLENPAPDSIRGKEVKAETNRWMQVVMPSADEYSVDAYGKFGVYQYGKTNVLLHYYARHLNVTSHDAMHELGRADQMDLDLVPHENGNMIEFKLLWKGKPTADRMIYLRGPNGFRKNLRTDAQGKVEVTRPENGAFTVRSSIEVHTPGSDNGESYEYIRHNITLVMR